MKLLISLLFASLALASILRPQKILDIERHPVHDCLESANETVGILNFVDSSEHYQKGAKHYSGYLDLSQINPAKDPIILVLNGGPGASSMYGMIIQWGSMVFPWRIDKLTPNPNALNAAANVVYVDNPIGVGFSHPAPSGPLHNQLLDCTKDLVEFLLALRATDFRGVQLVKNELHVMGSSFAGHYLADLGAYVSATPGLNDALQLKSLIMGNPALEDIRDLDATYSLVCDPAAALSLNLLLTSDQCRTWKDNIPKCAAAIAACRKAPASAACVEGTIEDACTQSDPWLYWKLTCRDPYDISEPRVWDAPRRENIAAAKQFLDLYTKDIGAEGTWAMFQPKMRTALRNSGEAYKDSSLRIKDMLTTKGNNIKLFAYAGDYDLMCPYLGLKRTLRDIQWDGQKELATKLDRSEADYDKLVTAMGTPLGNFAEVGPLRYARIFGSGHMGNEKRGGDVRTMIYQWIGIKSHL
ncbi:Alpha/Beta hydrolase protein [Lasiosphaeria ovina]|uniref:Alpha/Beta hydrolase protein n=1 Tax=Lasiosphaeria ovina TaxID=92902 RepID=A0AAE0KGI1_9PEZI|nr:Alpha/Beta hydrolase protein [Lasiosphaeria ovina]